MITLEKLKIYEAFDGDLDAWARSTKKSYKDLVTEQELHQISRLIQEIGLVTKGLASIDYENRIKVKLRSLTQDENVRSRIAALARAK